MQQLMKGFITIEGIEGVGKSTAVKVIQRYFEKNRKDFIVTREPGGTEVAEKIRQILLTPNAGEFIVPETELLLMFASRAQHIVNVILPALNADKWVICDRFNDASFAYQGGGRGIPLESIKLLDDWLVKIRPATTILLDAPAHIGLTRARHRGPQDRIEQEKSDFFERVRAIYLDRAKREPERFRVIDATQPLGVVEQEVLAILKKEVAL